MSDFLTSLKKTHFREINELFEMSTALCFKFQFLLGRQGDKQDLIIKRSVSLSIPGGPDLTPQMA